MRICPVNDLINVDFNLIFLNALRQFWHNTRLFQCIENPKKQNLFLFLDGCTVTYTNKRGETLTAHSGDIVYTPLGSEYTATLSDFQSPSSHTVGVNFLLFDENNARITQDAYLGKTIDVKGIVDYFDGTYQIKVFTAKDIIIK